MQDPWVLWAALAAGLALVAGIAAGFLIRKRIAEKEADSAAGRARILIDEASVKAQSILKEAELAARDQAFQSKTQFEEEVRTRRQEIGNQERRLDRKLEQADRREAELEKSEQSIAGKKREMADLEAQFKGLIEENRKTLEKIAGVTSEEAKKMLIEKMVAEAKHEAARSIKTVEEQAREESERRSRDIISTAIERMAGEWVQEQSVSTVKLPSDDMKGRIIGREGRNIRTLEALTGVDLIIDDTPGAVVLSSHNPIRREIARMTLERLLADGRIHPARIEEILAKVTQEVDKTMREAGQQCLFELDLHGVHPELVKLLGALRYRFSYAQNVLRHSTEVGFLAGIMASELGMDQKVARRAGLLHDIGKAVSHEIEGSHAVIGGELVKKYGESVPIVHAVWAHHEDIPQESALDHLVDAADALSGARPGARMESAEAYVKRLEDLEQIATSFEHVEKAYAIQAGRELRVMVQPEKMSDAEAAAVCRDIAKKIESDLTYPGQIKVTVIRETRSVQIAK